MQYFVTGGTGFIGAYVVRDLLREGHDVTIYDVAPNLEFLEDILGDAISDVTVVRGDVTDMPHLLRAMQQAGPQRVVHLASLLSLTSEENPLRAVQVNLEGTIHTFEAALAVGAEKVVWASSIAALGRAGTEPGDVIRNDALHAPIGLYGASKSFLERLAVTYERDRGLNAVGLRFTFVYGYGKAHTVERGSGVVYLDELIDKPALGQPSVVPNGEDVQDLSYVEDAAYAVVLASQTDETPSVALTVPGTEARVADAAAIVRGLLPDAEIEVRSGAAPRNFIGFDLDAIERGIGYRPQVTLAEGLQRTINALRAKHGLPLAGGRPI